MALVQWSQQYRTGNDGVDEQHQELFRLMNELYDAMKLGKGKDRVTSTLASLMEYTIHHFKSEERLMQDHSYPRFAAHKKIHDELTRRVQQLASDDRAGKVLSVDISEFLSSWLSHHIDSTDKDMIRFVTTRPRG